MAADCAAQTLGTGRDKRASFHHVRGFAIQVTHRATGLAHAHGERPNIPGIHQWIDGRVDGAATYQRILHADS
jgi:hypothetical protein